VCVCVCVCALSSVELLYGAAVLCCAVTARSRDYGRVVLPTREKQYLQDIPPWHLDCVGS
jgi:hypothetical protein